MDEVQKKRKRKRDIERQRERRAERRAARREEAKMNARWRDLLAGWKRPAGMDEVLMEIER